MGDEPKKTKSSEKKMKRSKKIKKREKEKTSEATTSQDESYRLSPISYSPSGSAEKEKAIFHADTMTDISNQEQGQSTIRTTSWEDDGYLDAGNTYPSDRDELRVAKKE